MRQLYALVVCLFATGSAVAQSICGTSLDRTPPVITPPADIAVSTAADAAGCGVAVALVPPAAQDACPVTFEVYGVPAGSVFPVGTTSILWVARDRSGNSSQATQRVVVTDATAPLLAGVADAVVLATSLPVADPVPVPHAADNCGDVFVSAAPAGPYPAGTTNILWTATDVSGNTTRASQLVTVVPAGTIEITGTVATKTRGSVAYSPLMLDVRVYLSSDVTNYGPRGIERAWNTATPLLPPYVAMTSSMQTTATVYTAVVPAGSAYTVIARALGTGSSELFYVKVPALTVGRTHSETFTARQ